MLDELSDEQKDAVYSDGHLLVLAGPGSGKTRALTNRCVRLIKEKVVPERRLLVITFTKNAADEMLTRIKNLTGKNVKSSIGTIHSIFYSIVKRNYRLIGYKTSNLNLYMDSMIKEVVKDILTEISTDFYSSDYDSKTIKQLNKILSDKKRSEIIIDKIVWGLERYRDELEDPNFSLYTPEELARLAEKERKYRMLINTMFKDIYKKYIDRLIENSAIDFMGMQHFAWKILQEDELIRKKWQNKFDHVLVDEAQDISRIQWELIKISSGEAKLFMVGDECQMIYAFRNASIEYLKEFVELYNPEIKTLTVNFRSQPCIVNLTNKVLENLEVIVPRELKSSKKETNCEVLARIFSSYKEEMHFITTKIIQLKREDNLKWSDFLIGLRRGSDIISVIRELISKGIPVVTNRGPEFFNLKEIKSVINYVAAIINPLDDFVLIELLTDCEDVGIKTVEGIRGGLPLYHQIKRLRAKGKRYTHMKNAVETIDKLQHVKSPVGYLIKNARSLGICQEMVRKLRSKKERFIAEMNLKALNKILKEYTPLTPENAAEFFADMVNRSVRVGEEKDAVMITTCHGTKGQEWSVCFYPFMKEGLFPHKEADLMEELRLFFVCVSRAKDKLFLTHNMAEGKPSSFLSYISSL